jgi:hypothetical protein
MTIIYKLARTNSRFLQKFVYYGQKSFITLATGINAISFLFVTDGRAK